jgi:tetratricopeptide (TPR) repeat protein
MLAASTSSEDVIQSASDLIAGLRELELGRADRAVAPLERFEEAVAASGRLRRFFRGERCHLALAYARIGRSSDALRVLAEEKRSARCRALRGDVLALAGKWPEAARAYRLAIATYPSLPVPYERAGTALLAREQPKAASAMFRSAIERAPRWADPRFGMAEALMQAGRVAEAEREYRAAAPLAPRWGALRIGWGEALWRLGRQEEARQAWQAAVRMDLSGANRLRLQQLLALAAPSPSPVWP